MNINEVYDVVVQWSGVVMARGRAGAGRRLYVLLLLALLAPTRRSTAGRSSTAPQAAAATRLRPAREAVALDWSAYADPQTASQRFRVRTHGPSAAFVRSSRLFASLQDGVGGRVEWRVEVTELERRRVRPSAPPCCL